MHLYMLTRGQQDCVDRYINSLHAQAFKYRASPHEKEGKETIVQLGVRPIQFWEITFPEPCLNEVLTAVGGAPLDTKDKRWPVKIGAWILKLARFFGLKPIPAIPPDTPKRVIWGGEYVDRKLIGLKDDQYGEIELI